METTEYRIARLLKVQPETGDVSSYLFALEEERDFQFLPGQFSMIGLPGVEEAAFSFSSLPDKNRFIHTIRTVGNVTRLVERLEPGRQLLVRGPFGHGWPTEEITGKDVLVVAGGIGLAPLRPFLFHCFKNRDQIRNIVLIYGARTPEDMVFQKDLALWQGREDVTTFYCVDQRTRESALHPEIGLVTQFLEGLALDYRNTLTYMCGPEIMMRFVARNLLLRAYDGDRIYVAVERRMRCGTAHCGHCQIGAKFVCRDGPVFRYSDIRRFADTFL